MNHTGDKGVKNHLDGFKCRPGNHWSSYIPLCHLHSFQVIIASKKTAETLTKFTVFFDLTF